MHRTTIAVATALTLIGAPALANDEGCTVILCLSNPAGWSAVAECIPPVQRAMKNMAKGRFPACSYAAGTLDGAKARMTYIRDGVTTDIEGNETPRLVRVLEFTDANGATKRVRF
jgi:hypothetical protein